nr:ACT domain-containing protein [Paludibacterium denitrificans]
MQSGRARSGIRNYLKGLQQTEAASPGDKLLKQAVGALSAKPVVLTDALRQLYMAEYGEKLHDFAEVLTEIGTGRLLPVVVGRRMLELAGEQLGEDVRVAPVTIRGNEGGTVQLSPCCNPIPGDDILGVITKGQGLVIHRTHCPNVQRVDHEKLLEVNWDAQRDRMFGVSVSVLARNERGALADIAAAISQASANIESVDTQDTHVGDGFIHIHFRLQVEGVEHLERVLNGVGQLQVVQQAERR